MELSKTNYGLKRQRSKNARSAIIQRLAEDFNLTPIIAEAYYNQVSGYFSEHANIELSTGQIAFEAVAAEEPAGRHIRLCRKITLRLNILDINSDFEVLGAWGLAGLRRHRLLRLTRQAYDQGALLTHEDLALLLTTSPATVKRDIAQLKQQGLFVMTRGQKHDMGPGLSHKTIICDYYFKGYTFSEIEQKTNHSEASVKRYLADFVQIAALAQQGFSENQIRLVAQKSSRLVREYLDLFKHYQTQDCQRLKQLLTPEQPGKAAKKKSPSAIGKGARQNG